MQQQQQMQMQQQQQQQSPMLMRQLVPPAINQNQMPFPRFDQAPAQVQQPQQPQQPQHPMGGEIRIHLQRIPIREEQIRFPMRNEMQVREIPIEVFQSRPNAIREPQRESQQPSNPFREAFGLTPDDIMNIQRMAEERIQQELRSLVQDEAMGNDANNNSDNDDDDDDDDNESESEENLMAAINQKQHEIQMQQKQQATEASTDAPKVPTDSNASDAAASMEPQILQIGRAAIFEPVKIPFDKMDLQQQQPDESQSNERADIKHGKRLIGVH